MISRCGREVGFRGFGVSGCSRVRGKGGPQVHPEFLLSAGQAACAPFRKRALQERRRGEELDPRRGRIKAGQADAGENDNRSEKLWAGLEWSDPSESK
jgi:hypothetical protein